MSRASLCMLLLAASAGMTGCFRPWAEWYIEGKRDGVLKVVGRVRLGMTLAEARKVIPVEVAFSRPMRYPEHPVRDMRRLRKFGWWPGRHDVGRRLDRLIQTGAISKDDWRRFVFMFDPESAVMSDHEEGWHLQGDLYHLMPLDGTYEVHLFRFARSNVSNRFVGPEGDSYIGLLVSPDGIVVGRKMPVAYDGSRRLQRRVMALDYFVP